MRTTLLPGLIEALRTNLNRARRPRAHLRNWPRVLARSAAGVRAAAAHRRARVRTTRCRSNGAKAGPRCRFFRRQGRPRSPGRAASADDRARRSPVAASRACRRGSSWTTKPGLDRRAAPAPGAPASSFRRRPWRSRWTWTCCSNGRYRSARRSRSCRSSAATSPSSWTTAVPAQAVLDALDEAKAATCHFARECSTCIAAPG